MDMPLKLEMPLVLDPRAIACVHSGWQEIKAREDGSDRFAAVFYAQLFTAYPQLRTLFPAGMSDQRMDLMRALDFVVDRLEEPDPVIRFLHQLGRDHLRYGIRGAHFAAAGAALLAAVRDSMTERSWTPEAEAAWRRMIAGLVTVMAGGADSEELPPYWTATVVDHIRVLGDLAIVRLQADNQIFYEPGQYVSVQIPQRPRLWRYLSPAIPCNDRGELEFHIRRVSGGWVSPAIISTTAIGDRWLIGPPLGALQVDRESGEDVLMVSSGTGLAPLRSLLIDMSRYGRNPRVHLFAGGEYPCDLYDLETLHQLAMTNPWLTIVPVLENEHDPWWHTGPPTPPVPVGMHSVLYGQIGRVVSSFGTWADRNILISGSPSMIRTTIYSLVHGGTPRERIMHDPLP